MTTSRSIETLARNLRELEESLLLPDVRKSNRLVELLADNFVEFASSGRIYTKADLVETLHRHSAPPIYTLRSSTWQLKQGQWQMVFHQATLTSAPE